MDRIDVPRDDAGPREHPVSGLHGFEVACPIAFDGVAPGIVVGVVVRQCDGGREQMFGEGVFLVAPGGCRAQCRQAVSGNPMHRLVVSPCGLLQFDQRPQIPGRFRDRLPDIGARIFGESLGPGDVPHDQGGDPDGVIGRFGAHQGGAQYGGISADGFGRFVVDDGEQPRKRLLGDVALAKRLEDGLGAGQAR